jgi:hypothetical protein
MATDDASDNDLEEALVDDEKISHFLLKWMYERRENQEDHDLSNALLMLERFASKHLNLTRDQMILSMDNLCVMGVVWGRDGAWVTESSLITNRGYRFVAACQPPKPKS